MWEKTVEILAAYWAPLPVTVIVIGGVIGLTAAFFISRYRDKSYAKAMDESKNAVAIFLLDLGADKVLSFKSSSIGKIKKSTVSEFYANFLPDERQRVIDWIEALLSKGESAPDFLETGVVSNPKTRKQYFYMLQADQVNKKRQVIHLERHKIKYLIPKGVPKDFKGLSSGKAALDAISECKGRGFTACFRFQYRRIADKDEPIDPIVWAHVKQIMYGLTLNRRYLLEASGNELLVVDLKISSKTQAMFFVKSCLASVNRYLSLSGYLSRLDIRIGMVGHQYYDGKAEAILDYARKTAQIAFDDEDPVMVYEKGRKSLNPLNDAAYRTEVERIINEKRLRYQFRPVYSVKSRRVIAYSLRVTPTDTYFDSMDELKDYATRTDDLGSLFSTVARNSMPLFIAERSDEKESIFFPVRVDERPYMLTTFARIPKAKTSRVVFLYRESDIKAHFNPQHPGTVMEDMRSIRAKGYQVALELDEGELGLPDSVYHAFDFFVCDFNFAGSAKNMDALVRSQMHVLVERLLKYEKPIVANEVEGWPSLELLVRSGLLYISAECFAPYSEMIQPVSPKSIKKVDEFLR